MYIINELLLCVSKVSSRTTFLISKVADYLSTYQAAAEGRLPTYLPTYLSTESLIGKTRTGPGGRPRACPGGYLYRLWSCHEYLLCKGGRYLGIQVPQASFFNKVILH